MSKKVAALRVVDADEVSELPELSPELRAAFAEIAGAAREGLLAMSVAVGLRVMAEMMEDELVAKVGAKHAKVADRTASRHGSTTGSVVLGGRRVAVSRPRARRGTKWGGRPGRYAAFADGTKVPVGLWLGDTENATVVTTTILRPLAWNQSSTTWSTY